MNILLTGAAGQLGSELLPLLAEHGHVTVTDISTPATAVPGWVELDISDADKLESLLNRVRPDLIVNTAAYTAVDQAETYPETSFLVNATLPGRLASWAKRNNARLIHYSTDYVFNGRASVPYLETERPDPQNVYGESKLAGEVAITSSGCQHIILRTSWVYSSHGKNFVLSMLNLARKGLALNIVDDQLGCPTWAHNLAFATDAVIRKWELEQPGIPTQGVFHYCDDESVSWHDFAKTIFSLALKAGLLQQLPELTAVPSSQFQQLAERPKWSVLNTGHILQAFDIQSASYQQAIEAVINEICVNEAKSGAET